jgi:cyclophilin family peptidyl-prolyl cis-trans isomerase
MRILNIFSGLILLITLPHQNLTAASRPLTAAQAEQGVRSDSTPDQAVSAGYAALIDALIPLWDAVSARDEARIMEFLTHIHPDVRRTALRGLANMSVGNTDALLSLASSDLSDETTYWFALSTQNWSAVQLRTLENLLTAEVHETTRAGIYLVLGEKGDVISAQKLLAEIETSANPGLSQTLALAISRIGIRHPFSANDNLRIVQKARNATQGFEQAAWLYGWYRNPTPELADPAIEALSQWMTSDWFEAFGLLRQYWINILSKVQHPTLVELMTDSYIRSVHPLEGVEVARAVIRYNPDERLIALMGNLLESEHIYVRLELLQDLVASEHPVPRVIYAQLLRSLETGSIDEPSEWMWRVRAIARNSREDARRIMEEFPRDFPENVHFINDYINTIRAVYDIDDVLDQLMSLADNPVDAFMVAIVEQVSQLVMGSPNNPELRALAAQVLIKAAQQPCLRLSIALETSNRSLDWESDQRDAALLAHIAAGREFAQQRPQSLYRADPELMKRLGPYPTWLVDTEEGTLVMRMDALRSPATVSALAYMSAEGWYPGSPFHRVVHNFVIQGGALWNCPYPGVPPFVVPTEATEYEFARGTLGIASSGRDTEGSQFFVMHMWHPHLNGRYTNFGHVVEGMEIVDRITQGTLILGAEVIPSAGW